MGDAKIQEVHPHQDAVIVYTHPTALSAKACAKIVADLVRAFPNNHVFVADEGGMIHVAYPMPPTGINDPWGNT